MVPGEKEKTILEPGGSEITTAAGGARWYRKPLKSFRWCDVKSLLTDSFDEWSRQKAPRLGASLAFYTLLSLAPLLIVIVSIVSLVFGQTAARHDIVEQVRMLVGPQGAKATEALLEGSRNTTHGLIATVFGFVTLLFGASSVLIELRDALNTIWEVPTASVSGVKWIIRFIKERLLSFAIVLSVSFLLVVSLAVSAWIAAIGVLSASVLPMEEAALHVLNFLISFVVITGVFAAIYKIVPDVQIEWHDVVLGGAATSLLFAIGKLILGLYLGKASFASSYGAAASLVVLVVWVYYSGQIFFLGAELTKLFANRYGSRPNMHRGHVLEDGVNRVPLSSERKIVIPPGTH
ncbi:MAG: YihY/virulence factor BrkB family protein [Acidobacteriaceae bacterium]|nr:YihY/virulence factor BrkB family protein [Acidobacteriaceae bacterium]